MCSSDLEQLMRDNPQDAQPLDPALPSVVAARVRWAARHEAARTIDDVLARRTRVLHLHAAAAVRMAPAVARILAEELGRDCCWQRQQIEQFHAIATGYAVPS